MFIPSAANLKIGDRIKITREIEMTDGTFTAGHYFTIVGKGPRGVDLKDDDGRCVLEAVFTHNSFEKVG